MTTNNPLAPVVKERQVACDAATAFDRFTRDIHRWWPTHLHSLEQAEHTHVAFEPIVGGRLFERGADGIERPWGTVEAWEPGARVAFSWHVGRGAETAQAIVVTFEPHGQGTRVRLVHAGWERLGERAAGARAEYDVGWDDVFGVRYGRFADGGAPA